MGGRGSSGGGSGGGKAVSAKMPELTGSAKQVAWAEDIRRSALESVDRLDRNYRDMASRAKGDPGLAADTLKYTPKDVAVVRAEVVETLQKVTSASRLIDARSDFSGRRIEELARLEHSTGQISEARRRRRK